MSNENKRGFVSALETALLLYSREKIAKINYDPHNEAWDGLETLDIHFVGGRRKVIDVTGDSCIAIMQDIAGALL
jgi:hypothetical protein